MSLSASEARSPAERAERVVVERARREREPIQLAVRARDEPGMPVTEVERAVRGQHVEVAVPSTSVTHAPSASAITTGQRVIVVRGVAIREREQLLGARACCLVGAHPRPLR